MKKIPFNFFDNVLVRIPCSTESFLDNCDSEEKILVNFEKVKEAILLSSPDLYNTIIRYQNLNDEKKEKALLSLYKYLIRTATRATPYGLFSGTFSGEWGESKFPIKINQELKLHLSLDYRILNLLKKTLEKQALNQANYYLNNTLEESVEKIKILKFSDNENSNRDYFISEFSLSEPLKIVINFIKKEKKRKIDIINHIVSLGADSGEAESYIDELINAKILISEIEIFFNNKNYLDYLCNKVDSFSISKQKKKKLLLIREEITKLNSNSKIITDDIIKIQNLISSFLDNTVQSKIYFKVDLIELKNDCITTIPNQIKQNLLRSVSLFNKLDLIKGNQLLELFVKNFISKYQHQAIPIMHLLDPNYGIIYGEEISLNKSPLIDDMPFFNQPTESSYYTSSSFFYSLLNKALEDEKDEIVINDVDLTSFDENLSNYSDTIHILFRIIDTEKNLLHIDTVGSGALNIASRFSYASPKLSNNQKIIAEYEKEVADKKNLLLAEIMHTPDRIEACNIIDNVDLRPLSIPITYIDNSRVDTILLEDILVTVRQNKIVLFSKSIKKEIIPCLSSMLLPTSVSKLPIYRFLADISIDHKKNYSFSWLNVMGCQNFNYFPRLRYKNIILYPAIWRIYKADVEDIINSNLSQESLERFLSKNKVPKKVIIKDFDNELLIDFDSQLSVKLFINEINKMQMLTLAEYYQNTNSAFQGINSQNINSQLVAQLYKTESLISDEISNITNTKIYVEEELTIKRNFPPGSEWVYFKIYCSENEADDILTEKIAYLVDELIQNKLIKSWFFIRYYDDLFHLRIRFLVNETSQIYYVMNLINNFISNEMKNTRICIDTYEREIERYREETMELSENLFFYDSQFTINFLRLCDDNSNLRWLLIIKAIDSLLDLFDFKIEDKLIIFEELKTEFSDEFNFNSNMNEVIKLKFRNYKSIEYKTIDEIEGFNQLLKDRALALKPTIEKIKSTSKALQTLIKSYIHMSINRCFVSNQRKHEAVLYNLMYKDYLSEKGYLKNIKKTEAN